MPVTVTPRRSRTSSRSSPTVKAPLAAPCAENRPPVGDRRPLPRPRSRDLQGRGRRRVLPPQQGSVAGVTLTVIRWDVADRSNCRTVECVRHAVVTAPRSRSSTAPSSGWRRSRSTVVWRRDPCAWTARPGRLRAGCRWPPWSGGTSRASTVCPSAQQTVDRDQLRWPHDGPSHGQISVRCCRTTAKVRMATARPAGCVAEWAELKGHGHAKWR